MLTSLFHALLPLSDLQLFDVIPVFGTIHPGQSQVVGFQYNAESGIRKECRAVCKVNGGPHYYVRMFAAAARVKFELESKVVDFGLLVSPAHQQQHMLTMMLLQSIPYTCVKVDCLIL